MEPDPMPTTMTAQEYRQSLLDILKLSEEATKGIDVKLLEEMVIAGNNELPIVRVVDQIQHYLRGKKWFTNLGEVDMCNCGALWPCLKAPMKVVPKISEDNNAGC